MLAAVSSAYRAAGPLARGESTDGVRASITVKSLNIGGAFEPSKVIA